MSITEYVALAFTVVSVVFGTAVMSLVALAPTWMHDHEWMIALAAVMVVASFPALVIGSAISERSRG